MTSKMFWFLKQSFFFFFFSFFATQILYDWGSLVSGLPVTESVLLFSKVSYHCGCSAWRLFLLFMLLSIAKTVPGSQNWLLPGDFLPIGSVLELEAVIAQ